MREDCTPVKVYWWATFTPAVIVLAFAIAQLTELDRQAQLQVVAGVALATLTGLLPVRIPFAKTSVTGAEIFVFLLLLIYGPLPAALAAAWEAAVRSYKTSAGWKSLIGSPVIATLAMYVCGSAFAVGIHGLRGIGLNDAGITFALLLASALAYFTTSTLLAAISTTLSQGEPVRPVKVLRENSWRALAIATTASIAGLGYVTDSAFGTTMLLVAGPIIALVVSAIHLAFHQAEADARVQAEKIAAAEREAAESARHMAAMSASEQRFHSAFAHAAVGMALISGEYRIVQANEALCHQLGRSETELMGCDLLQILHPADIDKLRQRIADLLQGVAAKFSAELRCLHRNGSIVWVASNGALFVAEGSGEHCLILQMQDVTARKHAETQLQHIAFHDSLTNLPNRSQFLTELDRVVARAAEDANACFGVLFLDFDRFKVINDSLGHRAGDELLITATQRMRGALRPTDLVARLGGDEFAILVQNLRSEGEVIDVADRVQRVLSAPMHISGTDVTTSASIGITTSALRYISAEDVMRDADIAMYSAKAQGKARYAIFDSTLHEKVSSRLRMESELRRAIENDELTVEFQPIVDLRTQKLYGFEALARWRHMERGPIPPDQFISVAEETGLIIPLGDRILEIACMHFANWRRTIPSASALCLHCNASPVQLSRRGYAAHTIEIVKAAGIPLDRIMLEVTENVLVDKLTAALPNLQELRDQGVGISIDDFGKGYSSLSALEELPIGEFKIDRAFVNRLAVGKGEAVVNAILALGQSMGKNVIVEGIETSAQLDQLLQLGCERGQGFLLGRPLTGDHAENLVRSSARIVRVAYSRPGAAA